MRGIRRMFPRYFTHNRQLRESTVDRLNERQYIDRLQVMPTAGRPGDRLIRGRCPIPFQRSAPLIAIGLARLACVSVIKRQLGVWPPNLDDFFQPPI
jgi:hypothetical protein